VGRLDCCEAVANALKTKLNLKGDYQAQDHAGQMVLVVVGPGGWTGIMVAKDAQGRVRKKLL
jgi:hypothetical protein